MRRVVLLALVQLCCAGLMKTAHADGWATVWSDLWRTPDQQGRAMLAAGRPAQAAARFHDPRWRAYADLEAARYPQAAKLLTPFTDADSDYNHGNALAESGQLQAALAAYDAALKLAPTDRDVRHNREVVQRALGQQQQSRRDGSGAQQPGGRGPQSNSGGRTAANGARAGAGQSGSSGQQPNSPQASSERPAAGARDAAAEAGRDARFAESVARARQGQGSARDSPAAGGARTPPPQSASERQLMLDEWLRQIPDSPAGLLRRQFLIDHMARQENGPGDAP
jgi:Ca-activated chloride channel homolog